jgi:hypothetical protein
MASSPQAITPAVVSQIVNDLSDYYNTTPFRDSNFSIMMKVNFKSGNVRSLSSAQISSTNDLSKLISTLTFPLFSENIQDKISDDNREDFNDDSEMLGTPVLSFKPLSKPVDVKYDLGKDGRVEEKFQEDRDPLLNLNYCGFKMPRTMNLEE